MLHLSFRSCQFSRAVNLSERIHMNSRFYICLMTPGIALSGAILGSKQVVKEFHGLNVSSCCGLSDLYLFLEFYFLVSEMIGAVHHPEFPVIVV